MSEINWLQETVEFVNRLNAFVREPDRPRARHLTEAWVPIYTRLSSNMEPGVIPPELTMATISLAALSHFSNQFNGNEPYITDPDERAAIGALFGAAHFRIAREIVAWLNRGSPTKEAL